MRSKREIVIVIVFVFVIVIVIVFVFVIVFVVLACLGCFCLKSLLASHFSLLTSI